MWLLFSLLSAFGHSVYNTLSKKAGESTPTVVTAFWSSAVAAIILLIIAWGRGILQPSPGFWHAAMATALINVVALPLLLKAYQWGELSSVFPMLLLTPVFMVGTSYVILGETVTLRGVMGMLITLVGLFLIARSSVNHAHPALSNNNRKGMLLGLLVAFLFSISANFDKLAALRADYVLGPALVMLFLSIGLLPLQFVRAGRSGWRAAHRDHSLLLFPTLMGLILVFDMIVFYTAARLGPASYTILLKRTSIIFGVFWGALFFKERNLWAKLWGVLIALAGLLVMLWG